MVLADLRREGQAPTTFGGTIALLQTPIPPNQPSLNKPTRGPDNLRRGGMGPAAVLWYPPKEDLQSLSGALAHSVRT